MTPGLSPRLVGVERSIDSHLRRRRRHFSNSFLRYSCFCVQPLPRGIFFVFGSELKRIIFCDGAGAVVAMAKASLRFVVLSFMALSLLALVLGMLEPTVETEAVGRRLSDDEISPPFPWGMPWFIVGKVKAAGPLKILGPPGVVAVLYWLLYCAGCLRECFPRNYVGSPPLEVLAFLVSGVSICWGVLYLDTFQYPDTLLAPEPEPDTWFWLVCLSVVLLALLAVLAACLARCYSAVPSLTILVFAITFPLVFTVLSPSALHLCDCGHNPTRVTGRDCVVGCCAPGFGLVDGACKALECSCAHGTLLESVCTEFGGEACSECNEGFLLQLALGSTAFLEPFLIFFSCGFASNKNSNFVVFTTRPAVQARRLLQFANLHLSAW